MKGHRAVLFLLKVVLLALTLCALPLAAGAHSPHQCPEGFPDAPSMTGHIEQADIAGGKLKLKDLFGAGKTLFTVKFNVCDGEGRPSTTGTGEHRSPDEPAFIRTSSPESVSCAACHNDPRAGGAGDFVANVFVLAQALDPVTYSVGAEFSNERNTLGMFGSGPIEMLAREMTADLQALAAALPDGIHVLTTKGVDFKVEISGGEVVQCWGADPDLVIKPFHQAGVVVSVREFTVNAMNHHHGMQAEERFDLNPAKGYNADYDADGVSRELTIGDITANTLFQVALGTPGRVLPKNPRDLKKVEMGEQLFDQIGCTGCHRQEMVLDNPDFCEPNPYNPPGTFSDTGQSFCFNMTDEGEKPRLEKAPGGKAIVKAYTDLKRHDLCDPPDQPDAIRYFCNEQLAQGRHDQDGKPGTEFFITRKLWDVGNSAPYGHRGDLTTITEAIMYHGGEGRESRDNFAALPTGEQASIVQFLKTLQVLPPGSPSVIMEDSGNTKGL
jgi:hypothetical protein